MVPRENNPYNADADVTSSNQSQDGNFQSPQPACRKYIEKIGVSNPLLTNVFAKENLMQTSADSSLTLCLEYEHNENNSQQSNSIHIDSLQLDANDLDLNMDHTTFAQEEVVSLYDIQGDMIDPFSFLTHSEGHG